MTEMSREAQRNLTGSSTSGSSSPYREFIIWHENKIFWFTESVDFFELDSVNSCHVSQFYSCHLSVNSSKMIWFANFCVSKDASLVS